MKSEQIEVKGLKELEGALLALQKEYGGKSGAQALRPAVVAAIKPLKAKVQDDTPVDEGYLLASVKQTVGSRLRTCLAGRPASTIAPRFWLVVLVTSATRSTGEPCTWSTAR